MKKSSRLMVILTVAIMVFLFTLSACMAAPTETPNNTTANSATKPATNPATNAPTTPSVPSENNDPVPPQNMSDLNVYTSYGKAGGTVEVPVVLSNNPGMVSMNLKLNYDSSVLTLKDVRDGGILGVEFRDSNLEKIPYILSWVNDTAKENFTTTGTLVTLVFEINENASAGTYPIDLSYNGSNYDIINVDMDAVNLGIANGAVIVK